MELLANAYFVILCCLSLPFLVNGEFVSCQTPFGFLGSCKPLVACERLNSIASKNEHTEEEINYLRKSLCGIANNSPLVCCPDAGKNYSNQPEIQSIPLDQCQTPSGEVGDCIHIVECNELYKIAVKDEISVEEIAILRRSRCGNDVNSKNVCCPKQRANEPVGKLKVRVNVPATQTCQTPDGLPGECTGMDNCNALSALLQKDELTEEELTFLRRSECEVGEFQICCPKPTAKVANERANATVASFEPCVTANVLNGECMPIQSCNIMLNLALNPNKSQQDTIFLQSNQCGYANKNPLVCCPKLEIPSEPTRTEPATVSVEVPATQTCQTPDGLPGECTGMDNCNALSELLQKDELTEEELTFLRRSECEVGESQICCPKPTAIAANEPANAPVASFEPCVTANVKNGECRPIQSCNIMLNLALNPNMSQQDTIFLQSNQCGYANKSPLVCCPKIGIPLEPTRTEPTPTERTRTEPTPTKPTRTDANHIEPATVSVEVLPPQICQTPNGTLGDCIAIENCYYLAEFYEREELTEEDLKYLEDSECEASDVDEIKVCCPKTLKEMEVQPNITSPTPASIVDKCQTPNEAAGTCVSLIRCDSLIQILKKNEFLENDMKYLKASFCADSDEFPVVCCPDKPEETVLPLPPYCGRVLTENSTDDAAAATGIDEYPWTALLIYTTARGQLSFPCGGTLIHERHVLTAAHCLQDEANISKLTGVRLGEWATQVNPDCQSKDNDHELCAPPHIDVAVEKLIVHPEYNSVHNDIALLRLAEVVQPTRFISPICLPFGTNQLPRTFEGTAMSIAGWGATKSSQIRSFKMKSTVNVRNFTACMKQYSRSAAVNLTEKHLCATGDCAADSVVCDSGGALMFLQEIGKVQSYILIGVDSLSYEYSLRSGFPGVYTQIGAYLEWLKKEIKSN